MLGQPFLFGHAGRIARLAIEQRLAAITPFGEAAQASVLMAYGSKLDDMARRAAFYVDRILKRREAGRPAGRAGDALLPHDQPEDREGHRAHGSPIDDAARRRGDRMNPRRRAVLALGAGADRIIE